MNPQLNNLQPPVQCYNPVQVLWTDVECKYLLNQRMARNEEYWNSARGERTRFWRIIVRKINSIFGTCEYEMEKFKTESYSKYILC